MKFEYSNKVKTVQGSIIRELIKNMSDPSTISFAGGNPCVESFPAEAIRRISDRLLRDDPAGCLQYSTTEGYGPLREASRKFANRHGNVIKDSDMLIITSGNMQVFDMMARLLCNEGDVVAAEEPAFMGCYNAVHNCGANLVGIPMEEDGADMEALERALSATPKPRFYYTVPNYQNPTGITTSLEKRKKAFELCTKYQVPILEDDPYGELRFSGEYIPSIKSFDTDGLVVYCGSYSKILSPGMRLAYCAGDPDIIVKMTSLKQVCDVHSNIWAQHVCYEYLTTEDVEKDIRRIQDIYRGKAEFMMKCLDEYLGDRIRYVRPRGGMFIWITLPDEVPMADYVRRCMERKVTMVPGNGFLTDTSAPSQCIRLSYSLPPLDDMREGIRIMGEVLDSYYQK